MSAKKLTAAQITAAVAARDRASGGAPKAVLAAFFPDPVTIGGLQLQPLTLATYMLLEKINSPLLTGVGITAGDVLRATLLLSLPDGERLVLVSDRQRLDAEALRLARQMEQAEVDRAAVAIGNCLATAFGLIIPYDAPKSGFGGAPKPGNGLGWPLTLLDCVSHEYGWTTEYALAQPLAQLFALYNAIAARYGGEAKGPTYTEREIIAALRAANKKHEHRTQAKPNSKPPRRSRR